MSVPTCFNLKLINFNKTLEIKKSTSKLTEETDPMRFRTLMLKINIKILIQVCHKWAKKSRVKIIVIICLIKLMIYNCR